MVKADKAHLDQALAGHKTTNSAALPPVHTVEASDDAAAEELAEERDDDDADRPTPDAPVAEQAEVRLESRKSKVLRVWDDLVSRVLQGRKRMVSHEREEEHRDEVLDLLCQSGADRRRHNKTDDEASNCFTRRSQCSPATGGAAQDSQMAWLPGVMSVSNDFRDSRGREGPHSNAVRDPRRGEDEEDDKADDALGRALVAVRAGAPARPHKQRPDNEPQNEDPSNGAEDDVEHDDARRGVDERDCEREQDPAAASAFRSVVASMGGGETETNMTSFPTPALSTVTPTWS